MDTKRLKAGESRRNRLLELPDGLLSEIISLLPLKEAVRLSTLFKQWRFVWTCHSHLRFDCVNVLPLNRDLFRPRFLSDGLYRHEFVDRVDRIMHQRCFMGRPKIDSLTVYYPLGDDFSSHINHWIICAVIKGVESIDIGLSECHISRNHPKTSGTAYKFDYSLLNPPGRNCSVKHLRLDLCIFNASNTLNCQTLMTLKLRRVCISDELLNNLLSNCFLLEKLSLINCEGPVHLNIGGFGSSQGRMKFLYIKRCPTLDRIEISSESLSSLEYTGIEINFSFKCVPNLRETYIYCSSHARQNVVTYALTRLGSELPQLEKLNLFSVMCMNALELPKNGPVFTNVKLLILTIYPFDDEDRLNWIAYILRAFPLLQKLELNLFTPNYIKQLEMIKRLLPECPHEHLTEVEINGFSGNQHEVELLLYLLENVIKLKTLVIDPCPKVYQGFNNWVYEEVNSWYKQKMKKVSDWLHDLLPKTVNLIVR